MLDVAATVLWICCSQAQYLGLGFGALRIWGQGFKSSNYTEVSASGSTSFGKDVFVRRTAV